MKYTIDFYNDSKQGNRITKQVMNVSEKSGGSEFQTGHLCMKGEIYFSNLISLFCLLSKDA